MRLSQAIIVVAVTASLLACKSREEKLQSAEDQGNMLAATKAKVVEGVGKALKNEGSTAAQTLTEGTGEVVKAVGKGIDNSLEKVKLSVQADLAQKGVGATRAALNDKTEKRHGVTVYVTLDKPYAGPLELRAYDKEKLEIGRAKLTLDEKEPTAKYVDFAFDERTPLLTADHFELR